MGSESKRLRGVDRISQLTNICHMLSFVLILDAVQTTILSRRWENLWISPPNLEFDDECFPFSWIFHKHFMLFVDHVLSLHDSTDIRKFSLHLGLHRKESVGTTMEEFSSFHNWICTTVRHNVVELDLDLLDNNNKSFGSFEFFKSVHLCKTLEVLKVSSTSIFCTSSTPTSGCFPSFKVLSVEVEYLDDSVEELFSRCPVLEDLKIDANLIMCVSNVNISAPRLKTLNIWLKGEYS